MKIVNIEEEKEKVNSKVWPRPRKIVDADANLVKQSKQL